MNNSKVERIFKNEDEEPVCLAIRSDQAVADAVTCKLIYGQETEENEELEFEYPVAQTGNPKQSVKHFLHFLKALSRNRSFCKRQKFFVQ